MQYGTVIAIVNEKGGTAKTTTAVSLSASLGALGKKVLLVDLDGQAASSRWLGVEEDGRLADALVRGRGLEPIPDVLPGVSLAPGSGKLDSVSHDLRPTQGGQLRKVLAEQTQFDYILIDCPPSLGNRLIGNALLAATHVIVPVETSILALDGLRILLTTLDDVRDGMGHEIVLGGVLACRYDARTRLSRLVLAELRRALPGKVFETVIRENVRMRECPASGQSILAFAPDSHAAEDYQTLAREMIEHESRWRQPAGNVRAGVDGLVAEGERLAVDHLRDEAAARVREAAAGESRPPAEAEIPPEEMPETPPAGVEKAPEMYPAEAEKNAETPESAPKLATEATFEAEKEAPRAASDEAPREDPAAMRELEDWLDKVTGAKPVEAPPTEPAPAEAPVASTDESDNEPETPLEWQIDRGDSEPVAVPVPPDAEEESITEPPAEVTAAEEPCEEPVEVVALAEPQRAEDPAPAPAAGDDYPALRERLRRLAAGGDSQEPHAERPAQQDGDDSPDPPSRWRRFLGGLHAKP